MSRKRRGWGAAGFRTPALAALWSTVLLVAMPAVPASAETREESGKLSSKDRQLSSGEYYETYDVELAAGQTIRADLRSTDFDTFVQINGTDAEGNADRSREWFNDDFENSKQRSIAEATVPSAGLYRVMVTSYGANETGAYELTIEIGDAPRPMPNPPGPVNGLEAGPDDRVEVGTLNRFDTQLEDGEYADIFPIQLAAGDRLTADLTSSAFDPYLYMRTDVDPELVVVNDDYEESRERSLITFQAPADGIYRIYVTTYGKSETGDYRLVLRTESASAPPVAPSGPSVREESGYLTADDVTLTSGEYVDGFQIQGVPGMRVRVELTSSDFDTYVMIKTPSGTSLDNDDFEGAKNRSVIETELTETGEHRVLVTSYKPGETGSYRLTIETSSAGGIDSAGLLLPGTRLAGELTTADPRIAGERWGDSYAFDGTQGTRLRVRLLSEAFDSFLILTGPDGSSATFDDDGNDRNAGIELVLPQTGRYTLTATSYSADETGAYELQFDLGDAARAASRRIYGVFVGIADYPGDQGDLQLCDVDAERIYSLLRDHYGMRAEDSRLLVNGDATVAAVAQALDEMGRKAGPNDLLLFFYSGHGGQLQGEANAADPDGIHETLALVDGQVSDDDFATVFNRSQAGVALVALDACFSGGFAKDVISARGRMGIFSSEEDVLSNVAAQFQAGGYLAKFMADALFDHRELADLDSDHQLTAHELCHYIGERYRDDVRSTRIKGGENAVDPSQDLSFQKLVVDRGGVDSREVLFAWE